MNDNKFYVYEHWRPDKGVCFYVGKGSGKRAWSMKNNRNRHHKAIVSKLTSLGLAIDVRIIIDNLSAQTALDLEIDRIAMYGRENLVNMTRGGEGLIDPSPEVRAKMSRNIKKAWTPEKRLDYGQMRRAMKISPSEETRLKLSVAGKGRKHTPETIIKMQKAAKIRGISPITRAAQKAAVTGKKRAPFTDDTRANMSAAQTMRWDLERAKKKASS